MHVIGRSLILEVRVRRGGRSRKVTTADRGLCLQFRLWVSLPLLVSVFVRSEGPGKDPKAPCLCTLAHNDYT